MGLIFMYSIFLTQKKNNTGKGTLRFINVFTVFAGCLWLIFAVFRVINSNMGGQDAPTYIDIFQNCISPSSDYNLDIAFGLLNRIIRHITADYHVYFFVIYSVYIISFLIFIKTFLIKHASVIPLCILVYLYLRGFTSIRSNLAISYLLISITLLFNKRYFGCICFALLTSLTHVSSAIYLPVLPFIYYYRKHKLPLWLVGAMIITSSFIGIFIQNSILSGVFSFLDDVGSGAYVSYASKSLDNSFFDSFFMISLPQICIFAMLIIWGKVVNKHLMRMDSFGSEKCKVLKLIAYYDIIMVPITYTLGVYRSYEYFMLPRLLLWGIIIEMIRRSFGKIIPRFVINVSFLLLFILWMYGRLKAYAETSNMVFYSLDLF